MAVLGRRTRRRRRRHQRGARQHAGTRWRRRAPGLAAERGRTVDQTGHGHRRFREPVQDDREHDPADTDRLDQPDDTDEHAKHTESHAGVPSYLTPAAPRASGTKPVKVLLVGDSIAGSLGVGLSLEAKQYGVQVANEGTPGCSLSMQNEIKVLLYTVSPDAPCDVNDDPASLLRTWRGWVDAYNPDVVVYVARGETFDQEVDGQWENLGEPAFDTYVASRYRQAVGVLSSRGAAVVLATTPYYDSGSSPTGGPWPEDDPSHVQVDNETMRAVAAATTPAADGSRVYVFDLNEVVSPHGSYSPTVGPVNVRCADGVHFTRSGGIFVGETLAPELAALGQAHASKAPGGAWPGVLPPSTPPWFAGLPCQ